MKTYKTARVLKFDTHILHGKLPKPDRPPLIFQCHPICQASPATRQGKPSVVTAKLLSTSSSRGQQLQITSSSSKHPRKLPWAKMASQCLPPLSARSTTPEEEVRPTSSKDSSWPPGHQGRSYVRMEEVSPPTAKGNPVHLPPQASQVIPDTTSLTAQVSFSTSPNLDLTPRPTSNPVIACSCAKIKTKTKLRTKVFVRSR